MVTSILDLFEKTVNHFAKKTAYQDLENTISFSDLYEKARAIGTALARVAQTQIPVVIYMEKNAKNIAAFLGVVYSGNFYVPIDKDMPIERIKLILECLQPQFIVCDEKTKEVARQLDDRIIVIEYDNVVDTDVDEKLLGEIRTHSKTTDLLYVLFTSGSTGIPKGVTISHSAVLDFVEWICTKYSFDETTTLCNQAPFYFDASVPDIFIPLKTGATVYIPPKSYYTFPKKILQFIDQHHVNTLIWVPSALCNVVNCHAFDVCVPNEIKLVIFCGEVMPCKHLNEWKRRIPDALYVNMYGPTEATYACMYYEITKEFSDDDKLPLGKSCENSEIFLLTDDNRQAEIGEIGEICVAGVCLSQGYYNAWEKTNEVFIQNPINSKWIEIIYRTGDLAYINKEGDMVFAGRKDFQIKRLGHRIELGEIENAIIAISQIKNAGVFYKESVSEIIAVYEGNISEKEVEQLLENKIPKYMMPNRYVHVDAMPMNLNGKIDRVKLKQEYIKE